MRRWKWLAASVVIVLSAPLASCAADESLLAVELATDMVAGIDFIGTRVRVQRDGALAAEASDVAVLGDAFIPPARVALFEGLGSDTYSVQVTMLNFAGAVVAERTTIVELRDDLALTVVVGSECRGVMCPGESDAAEQTTCAAGRCVDPRCSADSPEYCRDVCISDADCDNGSLGTCIAGTCLFPGCDDGNPCTDDAVDDLACSFTPNTATCDDGVFCNGLDSCSEGSCTAHPTPPCAADRCDEASAVCDTGCVVDADCPAEVIGDWSACAGFIDSCDEDGERSRTHVTFACASGSCVSETTTEMGACARTTEGTRCGSPTCDAYGACSYPACGTEGDQSRACYDRECRGGSCSNVNRSIESRACAPRASQEGNTCTSGIGGCQGVCGGGSCGDHCLYCGGTCTAGGCRAGTCP